MRKTDRPFQLATLGILCINFALFNVGLPTDLVGHLSDDSYYGLLLLLIGLIGGLAVTLLVKSRRWDLYGKFTFKASYFAVFVLVFLAHFLWDMFSAEVFPPTKNSVALAEVSSGLSGWALVLIRYVYACLLAPIVEELVFRDLVMTALASYQKYKLDMLVSASLFSLSHVWQHGWDLPSFIVYLVRSCAIPNRSTGPSFSMPLGIASLPSYPSWSVGFKQGEIVAGAFIHHQRSSSILLFVWNQNHYFS